MGRHERPPGTRAASPHQGHDEGGWITADVAHEPFARPMSVGVVPGHVDLPPVRSFQIVPIRGLPIVAAALAGLVAVIATNTLWGIDLFHVVGAGCGPHSSSSSGS